MNANASELRPNPRSTNRGCDWLWRNGTIKKIMMLIGTYRADRLAGGLVARRYNHAGCMKWNSFRKRGVVLLQRNRAPGLRCDSDMKAGCARGSTRSRAIRRSYATFSVIQNCQAWHAKGPLQPDIVVPFLGQNGRVVKKLFGEMNSGDATDQRCL